MSNPSLYVTIPLNQYHYERYSAYKTYHGLTNVDVVHQGLASYLEAHEAWERANPGKSFPFGPALEHTSPDTSFKGYIDKELKNRFQAFVDANKRPDGLSNYSHGYQQALITYLQQQTPLKQHMLPHQVAHEVGFLPEEFALLQHFSQVLGRPQAHILQEALVQWLELCQDQMMFPSYRIAPAPHWPASREIRWLSLVLDASTDRQVRIQAFIHGVPLASLLYTSFIHWAAKQPLLA